MERKTLGRRGEEIAAGYLSALGQDVIARNLQESHLEIDLITVDASGLHFVEVKSRRAPSQTNPEENVGYVKQRRIVRAARRFLNSKEWENSPYSKGELEIHFDVVSVLFWTGRTEVSYFPRAFLPMFF